MGVSVKMDGLPRYRELNIMNRVLNKDFAMKSYLNSALIVFSDVFRPASLMQSCKMSDYDGQEFPAVLNTTASSKRAHASHTRRI
jgi:hypothetical protein